MKIYIDLFCIENFDFMYWYISTDGINYIMQSLNVGDKQCNDIYTLLQIDRNEFKKSYDEELGTVWVYKTNYINENMINKTYIVRALDTTYEEFSNNLMNLYNSGKRLPNIG